MVIFNSYSIVYQRVHLTIPHAITDATKRRPPFLYDASYA
jgi:hypothetical protein